MDSFRSLRTLLQDIADGFILLICKLRDTCVYPEFNQDNYDMSNPKYNTQKRGLSNTNHRFGHDETLYQMLKYN